MITPRGTGSSADGKYMSAEGANSGAAVPSPLRRRSGGWEYPMSREEKKQRVMCLFEAELAEARKDNEHTEALLNENEALQARLDEKPVEIGHEDQEAEFDFDDAHPVSGVVAALLLLSLVVVGLALLVACVVPTFVPVIHTVHAASAAVPAAPAKSGASADVLASEMPSPLASNRFVSSPSADIAVSSSAPATITAALATPAITTLPAAAPATTTAAPVEPPNSAVTALRMWKQGLKRLVVSDCWQAEWYFKSALQVIDEEVALNTSSAHASNASVEAAAARWGIANDRAFAMVCSQRFQEAAEIMREQELRLGQPSSGRLPHFPAHLVNALGYAHFRLKDYSRAATAFQAGAAAEPQNPILWSNLAAAKMASGDIQAADDALYHAVDHVAKEDGFRVDNYQKTLIESNVQLLMMMAQNRKAALQKKPAVELWWGGEVPAESNELR